MLANLAPPSYGGSNALSQRMSTLHFPIGLGFIAATLRKAGWDFGVYDSYVDGSADGFIDRLRQGRSNTVLLSGFLGNYSYSFYVDLTRKIKEINGDIIIIMGGPMATTIPELLLLHTPVDFIVKGEGEVTVLELLNAIEKGDSYDEIYNVKGIYFKKGRRITFTGERERIKDLSKMPFPSYEDFTIQRYSDYLKETGRCWELSASRGCYGQCTFCKLTFGKQITLFPVESVVEHMCFVKKMYGVDKFNFVDDNFLSSRGRIKEFIFFLKYKCPERFKWRFQARADLLTEEITKQMVEVGLFDVSLGIESGSQEMLARYGKKLDINSTLLKLKAIKDIIDIHSSFIVGGPGETWHTVRETQAFIKSLRLKNSSIGILTLFPGTVLYKQALESGYIDNEHEYAMRLGPVYDRPYVNISNLSDDDLVKARDMLVETAARFGEYT